MKRILVPTDFSEHAMYALQVAAQIAKTFDSELLIINLLDLPTHMQDAVSNGVNIPEVMLYLNKVNERLDDLLEQDFLDEVKVSAVAKIEKTIQGIATYSHEHEVDLIVMGSHGQSGFQDMIIGSNTEKVIRNSAIPVLIIKQGIEDFKSSNIVFASDFSAEIKKPFEKVVALSHVLKAHLNLVMINTPNSFKSNMVAEKQMSEFVHDFDIHNYSMHIYNDSNVEKGVLNFASKIDADIIAVCTHGRTTFAHFFVGSISEDLLNHAAKPVLTFKI